MKKSLILLIILLPFLVNAQMNTWERVRVSEVNNPFKNYGPDPDPDIDSEGNRWVLKQRSLWRIKGTDTTKFENFPAVGDKSLVSQLLSVKSGSAAFACYTGSAETGFTNYLGYCDGDTLKFFSASEMNVNLDPKEKFAGIIPTGKHIWISLLNRLIQFDKSATFKEFTFGISSPGVYVNIPFIGDDYIFAMVNRVPQAFHDNSDAWEKIMPDDTLTGLMMPLANGIYMAGKKKIYRYIDGHVESFDAPSISTMGTHSSIDEFNKDFFAYSYSKGLVVVYKGELSTYRFTDFGDYTMDYYNEFDYWSKTLDNGISVMTVAGGDESGNNEELHFSFYKGKVTFEGRTNLGYSSFLYKLHNGDKYYYYTHHNGPYNCYLTIVKNDQDSTTIKFPAGIRYPGLIVADTNYLYMGATTVELWRMKRDVHYINGKLFYDTNKNGVKDADEVGSDKFPLVIKPLDIRIYPDYDGNFSFLAETGKKYTLEIPSDSLFDYVSKELPYELSSADSNEVGFTMGTQNPLVHTNFYLPRPRCNTTAITTLIITNAGFIAFDKVKLMLICDSLADITSAQALETKEDTLVFELTSITKKKAGFIQYKITFPDANSTGKPVTLKLISDIYVGGSLVQSKRDSISDIVRCAVDPNDKAVTPVGVGEEHLTLFNTSLDYLIRFENTGNDTAYTVTIHDTLDSNLNYSTLDVLGSSHPVITEINKDGRVVFHFENIMLPDSTTNKEKAQGFVRFSVAPKKDLAENTVIRNKAGIVFDKNLPVITNEVYNTFVSKYPIVSSVENTRILSRFIYPNPANELVNINRKEGFRTDVYDFTGRLICTTEANSINSGEWNNGLYVFRMFDAKGNIIGVEKVLISR